MRPRSGALMAGSAAGGAAAAWWSVENGVGAALAAGDALVGVVLLAVAVAAAGVRPDSRVGLLAGVAGITWFAGSLVPELQLVHRGALVHLLLSYPTGRLPWWPARIAVAVSYAAALVTARTPSGAAAALSTAVLVAVVAVAGHLRRSGAARPAGTPALAVTLLFTGTIAAGAVGRLAGWQIDRAVLWVYLVVVAAGAVLLLIDLRRGRWTAAVVAGLVVDLAGQPGTGTLAGHLRLALGDPSLTVGVWSAGSDGYVDDAGRVVRTDLTGADRAVTFLTEDDGPLAVLVHDATVLRDPALVESVAAAARLAVSNARLETQARRRLDDLARSRRRIVTAGDVQRRQLARDLAGVRHHLTAAAAGLHAVRERVAEADRPAVDELASELDDAAAELVDLARGLHPRVLGDGGFAAALESLRARAPVPVDIVATDVRLPEPVELTAYYVCAEALANVAKHAAATRVRIVVASGPGEVVLTVADNGRGGADPSRGTGLAGLDDRVTAIGGRLRFTSVPGEGTSLTATFPIEIDGTSAGHKVVA